MEKHFQVDWQLLFSPTEPLFEMVVRGTVLYLGIFVLLRLFRRQSGSIGTADMLVIVLIADAAQNGMVGESNSITGAAVLIVTIMGWDWLLDFLAHRSAFFRRFLEPKALLLIEDGKLLRRNLHKEMITLEELMGHLRQQGVERISDVKACRLEGDGHFSVLKKKP